MSDTKRVVVYVPHGEHLDWKVAAAERGMSVSELVCWRMRSLGPDSGSSVGRSDLTGDVAVPAAPAVSEVVEPVTPDEVLVFDEVGWRRANPEPAPSDRLKHGRWVKALEEARRAVEEDQ